MKNTIRSNFDMLRAYEVQLWRLGALAERYFAEDPNTSLLKLRQLSELLTQRKVIGGAEIGGRETVGIFSVAVKAKLIDVY